MVSKKAKAWLYSAATLASLLSFLCFVGVIALGAVGIKMAQDDNPCSSVNSTVKCVDIFALENSTTGANLVDNPDYDDFYYWMAACTGWGVVTSVVTTLAFWAVFAVVRKFKELEKRKKGTETHRTHTDSSSTPLAEETSEHKAAASKLGEAEEGEGDGEVFGDDVEIDVDVFGGGSYHQFQSHDLKPFNPPSLVTLFASILLTMGGLLCVMWGLALSYDHARRVEKDIRAFIIVEFLVGLVLPACLFTSGILMAIVLEYITSGKVDARKGITKFIPAVKYVSGKKRDYWVISDTYYFPLKCYDDSTCWKSCDKSRSTWWLVTTIGLSLLLTMSYFIDNSVAQIVSVDSCNSDPIADDDDFNCFTLNSDGSFDYVDCSVDVDADRLHCYQFLRLGRDVDVISNLSSAFAFYLLLVAMFSTVFIVVKILLHIKPSRFWGLGLILLGALAFITGLVIVIVDDFVRVVSLNVISIFQFLMVCLLVIVIGILVIEGRWWVVVPKGKPVTRTLVSYTDTTSHEIHKAEKEYGKEHPSSPLGHPSTTTGTSTDSNV